MYNLLEQLGLGFLAVFLLYGIIIFDYWFCSD